MVPHGHPAKGCFSAHPSRPDRASVAALSAAKSSSLAT